MKTLIIDISAIPFREFLHQHGKLEGFTYALWYRLLRPALVMTVWLFFSLYIYHSLVTVGGTAAEVASLVGYVLVVATMAGGLISWLIIGAFHNWIRARDLEEAAAGLDEEAPPLETAWIVPEDVRIIVVSHDDRGNVIQVKHWADEREVTLPVAEEQPVPEIVVPLDTLPTVHGLPVRNTPVFNGKDIGVPALHLAPRSSLYRHNMRRRTATAK